MLFIGLIVCMNGIRVWCFLSKFKVAFHRSFTVVSAMRTFPVIVMLPFCQQFLQVISRKIYGSVKLSFVCLLGTFNLSVKMRRRSIIEKNKASPAWLLISQLNPVIRGWVNYHSHVLAKKMFRYIDHQIWLKVWQWCVRRHPKKGKRWIRNKYFTYLTLSCYIQIAIDSYTVVKPALSKRAYKGLSGVPGNRYAPFLGEGSPAMNCPYPTSTRNFEMIFAGS